MYNLLVSQARLEMINAPHERARAMIQARPRLKSNHFALFTCELARGVRELLLFPLYDRARVRHCCHMRARLVHCSLFFVGSLWFVNSITLWLWSLDESRATFFFARCKRGRVEIKFSLGEDWLVRKMVENDDFCYGFIYKFFVISAYKL